MMVWGNGFFAKTMIPDHHAVQIPLIKRQQPLVTLGYTGLIFTLYGNPVRYATEFTQRDQL
ncbi:hypothetical protein XBFM1_880002 [Xenorhabdus bovienii str. feltiae Moldova]|uniref:Uncharacterized protein n=2 Tax=Xenorhabdus bovienii TaxID=40576 RepID=A0A0B6XGS3_XENBV|nr:hypothetical protein XBFM1_880002 [Xenorhabdus bovienii str. feltiae Moldova]CDM92299.1 protein of unknown function [Xenorhabdus bovienii]